MKATDLRIGNLVWNPIQEKPCKVNLAVLENVKNDARIDRLEKYRFQPIPLAEEWLLKFGFERFVGWDDMVFWRSPHFNKDNDFELIETELGYELPSDAICGYVHTLQNCHYFHALTGEELKLQE